MDVYFLSAAEALTKTFTLNPEGDIEKTQYPPVKEFTSHQEAILDIRQFFKFLVAHAALGHCLIKGRLHRILKKESRAGATLPNDTSGWLCLDADRIDGITSSDDLMDKLGLGHISYVEQLSASSGIDKNDTRLSSHLFIMLDKEYTATVLKNYLSYLNFTNPILSPQVRLSKSEVALTYSLDITVGQSDKLLFIAPPVCNGFADPLATRIHLKIKTTDVFSIPNDVPSSEELEKLRRIKINELRNDSGLGSRKQWKTKVENGVSYIPGATKCGVTGIKTERGRTYLNVNGGDSWAYWHPLNDPRVIFSFKGDGPLSAKEFVPEYYDTVSKTMENAVAPDGNIYKAYREFRTSQYFNMCYNPKTHELKHAKASSITQLQHYMEQHSAPWGGVPLDWAQVYKPSSLEGFDRLDLSEKTINLYTPPDAAKHYDPAMIATCPQTIYNLLLHVFGDHVEFTKVVINGWAYQVQSGKPPYYAVVAHGTTGTGKGIIMNDIFPVIFGRSNVEIRGGKELNEPYNSYMEFTQVVCYDEVDSQILRNSASADAFLKQCITEPEIPIRAMYRESYMVPRNCSIFMASNKPTPVHIEREDRRINIGEYQERKLIVTDADVEEIKFDAIMFRNYLMQYKVDEKLLRYIVPTRAREEVMVNTAVGASEFLRNFITEGSMRFILEQLPAQISLDASFNPNKVSIKEYAQTAYNLVLELQGPTQKLNVTREELMILMRYNFSTIPEEPYKFASYIKHYRVVLKDIRKYDKTCRGIQISINMNTDDWLYCQEVFANTLQGFAKLP